MSIMRQVVVFRDKNHHHQSGLIRYFASYQIKLSRCDDSMLSNNNRLYRLYRSSSCSLISCFTCNSIVSSSCCCCRRRLNSSSCSRYSSKTTTSSISSCDSSDSNSVGEYSLNISDYLKDPHPKFNVPRGIVISSLS